MEGESFSQGVATGRCPILQLWPTSTHIRAALLGVSGLSGGGGDMKLGRMCFVGEFGRANGDGHISLYTGMKFKNKEFFQRRCAFVLTVFHPSLYPYVVKEQVLSPPSASDKDPNLCRRSLIYTNS